MAITFDMIIGIIGALLVLTVIVVVHEYGHYKVGRLLNFKILEFAVGMGPKFAKWVRNGIIYSLRILPVGGFTKFYGEDEVLEDNWAFNKQPVGKRALVIAAGPIMNIILAWLLAVIFLVSFGDSTSYIKTVEKGSPAEIAGILPGDALVSVNGNKIDLYADMTDFLTYGFSKPPTMTFERNGKLITFENIGLQNNGKKNIIGVQFAAKAKRFGFFEAIGLSFKWLYVIMKQMITFLFGLIFTGQGADQVLGPVGTIAFIGVAVRSSLETALTLGALLSINLAIINLLPFPALDGGRLVFLGIEAIRKKPLPKNAEGYLNFAGFVALMVLMVILTYQDITRMVT